jgi:uncharacterized protein DUF3574
VHSIAAQAGRSPLATSTRISRIRRLIALILLLSLSGGCRSHAYLNPRAAPAPAPPQRNRSIPQPVNRPERDPAATAPGALPSFTGQAVKGRMIMIAQQFLGRLAPLAVTFSMLVGAPAGFVQQLDAQAQDRPIVRRRAPDGERRTALAFVRTELFFGTAKPVGAVTEEEFKLFLDEEVTPLFPDGLTVLKADGQFKGADGLTIKEDAFVVVLLYPVDGQKTSSRNIDLIRRRYMHQHQQESVLRVDDPFLVWVSF